MCLFMDPTHETYRNMDDKEVYKQFKIVSEIAYLINIMEIMHEENRAEFAKHFTSKEYFNLRKLIWKVHNYEVAKLCGKPVAMKFNKYRTLYWDFELFVDLLPEPSVQSNYFSGKLMKRSMLKYGCPYTKAIAKHWGVSETNYVMT